MVRVYRNLNKKGVWYSVQDRKTRRVVDRVQWGLLQNCEFIVSQHGQKRVRREKRKNVHAFIQGELAVDIFGSNLPINEAVMLGKVSYNPYTDDSFMLDGFKPLTGSGHTILLTPYGVFKLY